MLSKLKIFFEQGNIAQQAARSIRNGRKISLKIGLHDGATQNYLFKKENSQNIIEIHTDEQTDLTFYIPENSLNDLLEQKFNNVGEAGVYFFEKMISNDSRKKIKVSLHIGILSFITGGYLGVLTAGGSQVAKFLASRGLSSLSRIKETISRFRSE